MYPYIIIFNKEIATYAIMVLIGLFACGILIKRNCKNTDFDDLLEFLLFCLLGAFIGMHLLYALVNYKLIIIFITHLHNVQTIKMLLDCLLEIFGGSVFYGGLLGALLTAFIYCKKKKINLEEYTDIVAPFIALFHFFGRIGCFLAGCCYGKESKIGVNYPTYINGILERRVIFPIQLVEAALNLVLFAFLFKMQKKGKRNLFVIYLSIYAAMRFILEFFRGDQIRGFFFGLSTSQLISLIILFCTVVNIVVKKLKIRKPLK